jgi:neutral ceramidase
MRPFSQEYSELPVEEKLEDEELETPVRTSRWGKKADAWGISTAVLAILLLVVGIGAFTRKVPVDNSPFEDQEWLAHATRATGDSYLIGVGKADITGYQKQTPPQIGDADANFVDPLLS